MAIPNRYISEIKQPQSPPAPNHVIFERAMKWEGVKIGHYCVAPGTSPGHAHKLHEVFVPMRGSIIVEEGPCAKSLNLRKKTPGDVTVMPAGTRLSAHWEVELEFLAVMLTDDFLARATVDFEDNRQARLIHASAPNDQLVRSIAYALANELDSGMPAGRLYAETLVNTLAIHLLRHYSTDSIVPDLAFGGLHPRKLRRINEFIDENLDQDLSLAELATEADLSLYHFARAFKQATGASPIQYLTQRRIERAKELLTTSETPLAEIALSVGFKNQSHFTTLFRKQTEMTPRAWRSAFSN